MTFIQTMLLQPDLAIPHRNKQDEGHNDAQLFAPNIRENMSEDHG